MRGLILSASARGVLLALLFTACGGSDGMQEERAEAARAPEQNARTAAAPADVPSPAATDPAVLEACRELGAVLEQVLLLDSLTMSSALVMGAMTRVNYEGCRIAGSGTFVRVAQPEAALLAGLAARRWSRDPYMQVDGPDGTGSGVRRDDTVCAYQLKWVGPGDTDPEAVVEVPWDIWFGVQVLCAAPGGTEPPGWLHLVEAPRQDGIRRLLAGAFQEIPGRLRVAIARRGCTVPQADWALPAPHNIVRGAFTGAGRDDWAVLCSRDGRSSILVFPEGASQPLEPMGEEEDRMFLQGIGDGQLGYSRVIGVADSRRIRTLHDAFDDTAPLPTVLDHDGVSDAFVEKASVIHYHDGQRWWRFRGMD